MKKILLVILLLMAFILPALTQERDFYIEVISKKETLAKDEIFTVVASIMNVTQKEQRICSWSCSYDENWQLDGSFEKFQLYRPNCEKNIVSCVTLRPLERYDKELYLQVGSTAKKGKASFRLGFIPCVSREECFETAKENQKIFWSQEATVKIK